MMGFVGFQLELTYRWEELPGEHFWWERRRCRFNLMLWNTFKNDFRNKSTSVILCDHLWSSVLLCDPLWSSEILCISLWFFVFFCNLLLSTVIPRDPLWSSGNHYNRTLSSWFCWNPRTEDPKIPSLRPDSPHLLQFSRSITPGSDDSRYGLWEVGDAGNVCSCERWGRCLVRALAGLWPCRNTVQVMWPNVWIRPEIFLWSSFSETLTSVLLHSWKLSTE